MDDPVDARLAAEVSRDPRATLAQLSERVGLSASAVQARLRKLESTGVITGYQAILDPEAVGKPLAAFIEITPLDPRQPDDAPEQKRRVRWNQARISSRSIAPAVSSAIPSA